jgi:hypothetical protein
VRSLLALAVLGAVACGPRPNPAGPAHRPTALLPDVRIAKDRPPVVLVARRGDPAAAIAVAVTTAGVAGRTAGNGTASPEPAVALAGVVEGRLAARGIEAAVTPAWDGVRASLLVAGVKEAESATLALHAALVTPIAEGDLAHAKKKLAALARRPLPDRALARWAECVGSPHAPLGKGPPPGEGLTAAGLESWRAAAHGLPRVAVAVAGDPEVGEAVADAILHGDAWRSVAPPERTPQRREATEIAVYDAMVGASASGPLVHTTLDVPSGSAAVAIAEALGDPRGPLASRLATLEPVFRIREVTGAVHVFGGCVGVVLDAPPSADAEGKDLAERIADAIALVHVEAEVHLEAGRIVDGRTLARRTGDAREAAERGAWWALTPADAARAPAGSVRAAAAVGIPLQRNAPKEHTAVEPSREAIAAAVARATASWQKPVVEPRTRTEPGQGETWVLLASPCGTVGESDDDAGLTALFTLTAAEMTRSSPDARVEPWVASDGAGLLVHGPALPGESPAAHARRLSDVAARSFASEALAPAALSRARTALLRREPGEEGDAFAALSSALAPGHPSWVMPWGRGGVVSRSSDAAVRARAQALRSGPLRLAVLANVDPSQGTAAVRAADRWVDRRGGDRRACPAAAAPQRPKPGTYAAPPRPGARPEAYLAYPLPAGDAAARTAALIVAGALDEKGGLLERALGRTADAEARVVGWPRAPALVVRIQASQSALDGAVMQTRALFDRVHKAGLGQPLVDRGARASARARVATSLDPRARLVATFRGEPVATAATENAGAPSAAEVRTFAGRHLGEDSMIVVAARPNRPAAESTP